MSTNTLLFSINNEGKVYALPTNGSCWREFMYLGLEFKTLSAVSHFLWAVGGDRQIYLHVHGLEIPIRVKEESYENERWLPLEGFSGRMLPTDRYHFSSQDGLTDRSIDRIRLPSMAWQWEGDWQLELTLDGQHLDHDGWSYAVDFPAQFGPVKQWKSCVRRRKWFRYRKFSAMNSWCAIAPLHKDPTQEPFIGVAIGGQQVPYAKAGYLSVWAITAQGRVMYRVGVSSTSPEGQKWINVSIPPNCDVKQISVGPTGLVWATLWSGRALVRKGITNDVPSGDSWIEVKSPNECKLFSISVGHNTVWATSTDTRVWFRKGIDGNNSGTSEVAAIGSGWLEISGNMTQVSVGQNDQVFSIGDSDKSVYWRSGITPAELTGKRWRMVQANMQLSRTSSTASVVSSQSTKHSSLNTLQEGVAELKTNKNLQNSWEESHSAPIEHTMPIKSKLPMTNKGNAVIDNIDLTGKSYETTLKNPRAWSPVRSVGSVVGMEAQPDSDSSVFDVDSGMYFDEEVSQTAWGIRDAAWTFVEAGACSIDTLQIPNWFTETHSNSTVDLSAQWRLDTLHALKNRYSYINDLDMSLYGLAIEEKGWTRSAEARLATDNGSGEDCIVSLYWHSTENTGTLSVLNPDGIIKFIINVSEVSSVTTCSEPGSPQIALGVPRQRKECIKIIFSSEMEQEDWYKVLSDIISQINGLSGRPSNHSIWAVTNSGDVLNWDPQPMKRNSGQNDNYIKEFQVSGKDIVHGCTTVFPNSFLPGSSLKLSGCLFDEVSRFHINLQGPEVKKHRHRLQTEVSEVPLHFNVRFDEGAVVCNTKIFNSWGLEERHPIILGPGQEFSVQIVSDTQGFKVYVNDKFYCFFEHRLPPECVISVHVRGPLKLFSMEYATPSVIVSPEEMAWRALGGALRRVEASAAGAVWGLTHDHRAWLYTGGYGGGLLQDISSSEGVHPMTDTRTYCVYENQRWNPLSGYSGAGLPTDRPMWSDASGRHKRTRDHTKLISRHWHWISEWMVDYGAAGGVDGDGWQYATDFPAPYRGRKAFTDCVRRRRWLRKAQLATAGPWLRIGNTPLADVSLWSEGDEISVWAVTVNGEAIYRTGVTAATPAGAQWEHVSSPAPLTAVSCARAVWALGRRGELSYRDGVSQDCPTGKQWKPIEPPRPPGALGLRGGGGGGGGGGAGGGGAAVACVSLAPGAAWVVLADGSVAVRTGLSDQRMDGTAWKYLPEEVPLRAVSAGAREVWAVSAAGAVLRRLGVAPAAPAGVLWQPLLSLGAVHVSARGRPF